MMNWMNMNDEKEYGYQGSHLKGEILAETMPRPLSRLVTAPAFFILGLLIMRKVCNRAACSQPNLC